MLAYYGDVSAARAAANAAIEAAAELGGFYPGLAYAGLTVAALAAGDVAAADDAIAAGWHHLSVQPKMAAIWMRLRGPGCAGARGSDRGPTLGRRRRRGDERLAPVAGADHARAALRSPRVSPSRPTATRTMRSQSPPAPGHTPSLPTPSSASPHSPSTPAVTVKRRGYSAPQTPSGSAAATSASRSSMPFTKSSVAALRDAMGEKDFESAWAEGAALSTDEAIAYAQRRRGERKRPTSGWASLTPTERDVVRLVSEGLANNDIATRLFVSPRTVQTHLTHVYTKLGLTSRVQLAQEAARHG